MLNHTKRFVLTNTDGALPLKATVAGAVEARGWSSQVDASSSSVGNGRARVGTAAVDVCRQRYIQQTCAKGSFAIV